MSAGDAITAFAGHLAEAIRAQGLATLVQSHLCLGPARTNGSLASTPTSSPHVLWQYNPFSYGWKGLAPWTATLPLRASLLRRGRICVTFHELYFPFGRAGAKGLAWAVAQRAQCAVIGAAAHAVVATTGARVRDLQRLLPWKKPLVYRIPVGSNLPVAPLDAAGRWDVRAALGATDETVLLGTFGSAGGGLQAAAAIRSVGLLRRQGIPVRLALLGRVAGSGRHLAALAGTARAAGVEAHVVLPGPAPAEAVSRQLSALDVFLALYDDGTSGRRTGTAAALAHGLPIVGTLGQNTDLDWFRPDEVTRFARSLDAEHVAEAVAAVAGDPATRLRLADGARRLHTREFAWDAIARRYLDVAAGLASPAAHPAAAPAMRRSAKP